MPPTELAGLDLRRRWRSWTKVVRAFVTKPGAASRYDPAEYEAAHQELVAACEERAAGADGPARDYFRELADVARPWLSTRSLEQADRELLMALYLRCYRIDGELNRGVRAVLVLPRLPSGYAVLAVVILGLAVVAAAGGMPDAVDDLIRHVRAPFRQLTTAQQLLAAGTVVAAVGGWLVWQVRRS